MGTLAVNYRRRIAAGVSRLGMALNLTGSVSVGLKAIILPTVVTVVNDTGTASVRLATALASSAFALDGNAPTALASSAVATALDTGTYQAAASGGTAPTTTALQTIYLLQDAQPTTNVPIALQTFTFDGLTWTVRQVSFAYVQGERIAIITTCTAPTA